MAPTQPSSQALRTVRLRSPFWKAAKLSTAVFSFLLLLPPTSHAQGEVPLIKVATDQDSLSLSNQFGVPAGTAINQTGDFAFVGSGGTALFFRAAGASTATRLLQIEDEAPGFPGSQIFSFSPQVSINAARVVLFGIEFTGADKEPHSALLTYDGTNYHTVVQSEDPAPGSTGAVFGLDLIPGSINDEGDINFAAVPFVAGQTPALTFYIVPAGGAAKRIASVGDTPPPQCTWCTTASAPPIPPLQGFFPGTPTGVGVFVGTALGLSLPQLNQQGQMLLNPWGGLFIGGKDGSFSLVSMARMGACSPQLVPAGTNQFATSRISGFLNNAGAVAYTNPSTPGSAAICIVPAGGGPPSAAVTSGDVAPASIGGTIESPIALGMNDSGDIVFVASFSGNSNTASALLRYHSSSNQSDVVAFNCELAPGTPAGVTFSPFSLPAPCGQNIFAIPAASAFSGVSMANDGRVSFRAYLSNGGSGIYRQTGAVTAASPELIFLDLHGSSTPFLGIGGPVIESVDFSLIIGRTKILDNGSTVLASNLTGGAADFAVYLGTPGNLETLMSTADSLPSGARTILVRTPPKAAGHFVAFTAEPAAGRRNLLLADTTSGSITRVVSDNDPALATAGGAPEDTILSSNFFLNDSGQITFEMAEADATLRRLVIGLGGGSVNTAWLESLSNCATIFLWSPSSGLAKVAAAGDAVPGSGSASRLRL
jgi:hypothetical protein